MENREKAELTKFLLIGLDESVNRLTENYHEVVYTEDQTAIVVVLPPLLDQLYESLGSTNAGGRGASQKHTRAILDFGALMLISDIQTDMRNLWKRTMRKRYPNEVKKALTLFTKQIHALANELPPEDLQVYSHVVTGWDRAITNKFDPPVTIEISEPCPNCNTRTHTNRDNEVSLALRVLWRRSFDNSRAECQNCGRTWVGETELRHLRWELDSDDTPTH